MKISIKKTCCMVLAALLCLTGSLAIPAAAQEEMPDGADPDGTVNLLVNPDWESGIDGWEIQANNQNVTLEDHDAVCSILYQDVPVESHMEGRSVKLSANLATAPEDPTQEEIILSMTICGEDGNVVNAADDGSVLYDDHVTEQGRDLTYHEIMMDIPDEAAFIRVSMEIRKQGNENSFNFSDLKLEVFESEAAEDNPFVRITQPEDGGADSFSRVTGDGSDDSTDGFARVEADEELPLETQPTEPETEEVTTQPQTEPVTGEIPAEPPIQPQDLQTGDGEYTQIEYIQATGTQYIDTGFADTEGTVIEYKATWDLNAAGFYGGYMVGACAKESPYGENAAYFTRRYQNEWKMEYGGHSESVYDVPFTVGQAYEIRFSTASGDIWMEIDGQRVVEKTSEQEITSSHIMIFSSDYQLFNESNPFGGNTSGRLFYAKIYDHNGKLVRDYIPCIQNSNGQPGLFDRVEQKFYGNNGTGEFVKGPSLEEEQPDEPPVSALDTEEFTKIEYIQATGTQYIDTGFADMSGTTIEYKATWDLNAAGFYGGYMVGACAKESPYGENGAFYTRRYQNEWKFEYGGHSDSHYGHDFKVGQAYEVRSRTIPGDLWMEIDGEVVLEADSWQNITSTNIMIFSSEYQLYNESNIFGSNTAGRLYYARIYNHYGELVRDYVPCIQNSNGQPGLFDQVEQKFYGNNGTGEFVAGPSLEEEPPAEPPVSALDTGDYTKIEYLEADGTQYIDTGFADMSGTTIEYKATWDLNAAGFYGGYMVGACAKESPYGENEAYYNGRYQNEWKYEGGGHSESYYSLGFNVGQPYEIRFCTVFGDTWMEIDGEKVIETVNNYNVTSTNIMIFSSEYQLYNEGNIFGGNTAGRLYYARIYNHYGELVRDYVPCIQNSNGQPGLFDQVEQKFYGNNGTGEFGKGPSLEEEQPAQMQEISVNAQPPVPSINMADYTRIEYIGATGTQYIDTGFADMSGTTIEYKATWDLNAAGYYGGYMVGACAKESPYGENEAYYYGRYQDEWKFECGGHSESYYSLGFNVGQPYEIRFCTVYGDTYGDTWMEIDGEKVIESSNNHNVTSTDIMIFSSEYQLYNESNVFGGNTSGRLYYARIYNHYGELVRDYVPCIQNSNGQPGLFDLVEQKFYGNNGTGEFVKGPVVQETAVGSQSQPETQPQQEIVPVQPETQPQPETVPVQPETQPQPENTSSNTDAEYLKALVEQGKGYYYGTGPEGYNREKAQQCFREAAEADYGEGWYYYGNLLMNCIENQRYERAMGCYERACDCGFYLGYIGQGLLYENGLGTEKDYNKAYELYNMAVDAGFAEGYCGLGDLYEYGNGVYQDEMVAMEYYKMALDGRDFMWRNYAKCQIAEMYLKDYPGIGLDYTAAFDWYMKAANEGYGSGYLGIGNMYYSGNGVEKDRTQAFTWFERAAAHGNVAGMYDVAFMLDHEQGVAQDYERALSYYLQAANLGDDDAMYAAGVMYESGHGTAVDYGRARYWLELALDFTDDMELKESIGEELAYIASSGY